MRKTLLSLSVLTLTIACGKNEEPKREPSIRARAEKAACALSGDLFSEPKESARVSTLKDRKDLAGNYKATGVEVYQYAYIKNQLDGSSRVKYSFDEADATKVQGTEICDSNGMHDQTKPSQTPPEDKLVIIQADGPSEFNLPAANITEKFKVQGNGGANEKLKPTALEQLRNSGSAMNKDTGAYESHQILLLKNKDVLFITYVETAESITVTRATYKNLTPPPPPAEEQTGEQP